VSNTQSRICCDMRRKVALGVAKIYSKEECGVDDSTLIDFHDFAYESPSGLPVRAALVYKFCPWCGVEKTVDDQRRTTEVIQVLQDT